MGDACDANMNKDLLGIYISIKDLPRETPATVSFSAIIEGNPENIMRNFDDGNSMLGKTVSHAFTQPGTYRIQATAKNATQEARAQTIIKI